MATPSRMLSRIDRSPAGIGLAELLERHPDIPRRTAQRMIQAWLIEGRIAATGKGPARRYRPRDARRAPAADTFLPPTDYTLAEPTDEPASSFFARVPLSADSFDVMAYVRRPLSARHDVGYHDEFLEDYIPNRTAYLSDPLRRELMRIGNLGDTGLTAGIRNRAILDRMLVDLSWASSRLEGNSYSHLATRELIEEGRTAEGKALTETQMILNHKRSVEFLQENIADIGFDRRTVREMHRLLAENLLANPDDEGRLRRNWVEISGSLYHPVGVPQRVEELLGKVLAKASAVEDPFEQSFFAMVHLPYLQPFVDVNKRVSRLMANVPLLKANLCPLTFVSVSAEAYAMATLGVYEMNRVELLRDLYRWAYVRSAERFQSMRRDVPVPEPLRLIWRTEIRDIVREVVRQPDRNIPELVRSAVAARIPEADRQGVEAVVFNELTWMHEASLFRFGLQQSEFERWAAVGQKWL